MDEKQQKNWYVMRSLFRTELKMRAKLEAANIESFVPTTSRLVVLHGRKKSIETPIVSNLIFVHSDTTTLQPFLDRDSRFQYIFVKGGKQHERMVVRDEDMQNFIRAVEAYEKPLYFKPSELELERGTHVRVIGGPLDGMTGVYLKVKGARSKRLVVIIPDTLAVAVDVQADLIEVIE